ncbi:MAG: hypothetical protein D6776_00080, partial [Planctomycetota bacterium]
MSRTRRVNARQIRKLGSLVVLQFYLTAKLHQLYGGRHANTREAADALADRVAAFCDKIGRLTVHCQGEHVFVNQVRLRREHGMRAAIAWWVERCRDSGLSSVTFRSGGSGPELSRAIDVLASAHWNEGEPPPPLGARLRAAGVESLRVRVRRRRDEDDDLRNRAEVSSVELARAIYHELQRHAARSLQCLATRSPLSLRDTRLLVQRAADLLADHPEPLIAAVSARAAVGETDYLARHMANVCVLSLALAVRLGIERRHLLSLGCAALLYDAGMVRVPLHERERPAPLDATAMAALGHHPQWVVQALLDSGDRSPHTFAIAAIVARHHDDPAYPRFGERRRTICTEILMLADAYDALASQRPWRPACARDEILTTLFASHDPALVKLLANVIGVYPVGTLVRLDSGEVGIV